MMTMTATKGNEVIVKEFGMYFQALTVATQLQNAGYEVKIERA